MVKKVTKRLRLNLKDIPAKKKAKAKEKVGQYLLKKIQKSLDDSRSPVTGGKFKKLSKDYKGIKKKKGGSGKPDLFLRGDLRSQIQFEAYRDGIEIGVFNDEEAPKADNHNKNSAKSKGTGVPLRQFIPYNQKKGRRASFDKKIREGVEDILEGFRDAD